MDLQVAEFRGKGERISRVVECELLRLVVCRVRRELKARVGLLSQAATVEELDGTHVLKERIARRTHRNQDVARQSQRRHVGLEHQLNLCTGIYVRRITQRTFANKIKSRI